MWFSRKLSSLLKQKLPLHSSSDSFINSIQKKKEQSVTEIQISFVLAVTSSVNNTGKSALIKCLGLEELNDIYQHSRKLYRLKNNEHFIIQILEYNGVPPNLEILDGVLLCYDITNINSMDYLPDMINVFVYQHIPCLLIGLKSDLTVLRTVDPQLGYLLGKLYGIQVIESNNFTSHGIQLLQKYFMQFIYSDKKVFILNQQNVICHSSIVNNNESVTDDTLLLENHYISSTIKGIHSHDTVDIISRSKSSSSSNSNSSSNKTGITSGDTIATIIDGLLDNYHDENAVIIFQTVFRKFMKPLDLVNILIRRFESDLTQEDNSDTLVLPTVRQERIYSFFCIWLSKYWGDFKSSVTRRIIIEFLEKISPYDPLVSVKDVLLPLASREPVIFDKDIHWGMCDDGNDDDADKEISRKKDSGYNEWISHNIDNINGNDSIIIKKKPLITSLSCSIRRAVSINSHQTIPTAFRSSFISFASQQNRRNSMPLLNYDQKRKSAQHHQQQQELCPSTLFGGGLIPIFIEQKPLIIDPFQFIQSISPHKLAEQLTWIEAELFRKIQPRDFLRHLWSQRKNKSRPSTHHRSNKNPVLASIEHFNFISGWIASLVVNQTLLEKRVVVFEFCLQTAVELRKLNNFNTLMAVLAGVNSAAVLRLKLTRDRTITKNKILYNQFLELESLMSSERSFSNYRSTLKQTEYPGIPYLGIHQQDLVSLGEGNKDHKTDGKVHWRKFRLMGESIIEMIRFQYPTYLLQPNPCILYFIGHQSIPSEDERYEISKQIEPRPAKSSLSASSSNTSCRWLSALK